MKKLFLLTLICSIFLIGLTSAITFNEVACYPLNDNAANTIVTDSSGFANVGTSSVNTNTISTTGLLDSAFTFGGANYFTAPLNSSFNITAGQDFYVAAWVKINATGADRNIFHMYSGKGFYIQVFNSSGYMRFTIFGTSTDNLYSNGGISQGVWHHIIAERNSTSMNIYIDGVLNATMTGGAGDLSGSNPLTIGTASHSIGSSSFVGDMDEPLYFNRSVAASDPTDLYNAGSGLSCAGGGSLLSVTLGDLANNTIISTTGDTFTANQTSDGVYNLTNFTYFIWYSNGTIFNQTTLNITGSSNSTSLFIDSFTLGSYLYNGQACQGNGNGTNCTFANNNNSFIVGASLTSLSFNNNSYETKSETFTASFDILAGSEISLAQLVYNDVNYSISDITIDGSGTNMTITRTIDLPLNDAPLANQTNNFSFRFTYSGDFSQTTSTYNQGGGYINLQYCNATYNIEALNLTILDETTQEAINTSAHATDHQFYTTYWLGSGDVYKNYSYSSLASTTLSNYTFCLFPNLNMQMSSQSLYDAVDYSEREYYINNATISNTSSYIPLYLLNDSAAVKFTITIKQGTSFLTDSYVTIAKFFIGDGTYKTISIRKTDDSGQFVEYLELDRDYRFSVVKDGQLLGTIDKRASCSTAPCEFTLQIDSSQGDIWDSYNSVYGANIFSNLTYNSTSSMVTYTFIDTTGLATYFRLEVNRSYFNETKENICNTFSYSSSGTITCNLTGYNGDFIAHTYVSRSPEKLDKVLTIALSEIVQSLGLLAVLASFFIILTITLAAAAVSGGNPSVILFGFGFSVLVTKLMTFLPFSWGIVALMELVIIWLIKEVRS